MTQTTGIAAMASYVNNPIGLHTEVIGYVPSLNETILKVINSWQLAKCMIT